MIGGLLVLVGGLGLVDEKNVCWGLKVYPDSAVVWPSDYSG